FREFKALWDPDNRMNPGKLIDAVRGYDPLQNLKRSPQSSAPNTEVNATPEAGLDTHFVFANDGGSLTHATERCVGVGACRKTEGGVMCPSYRATAARTHSTRAAAALLRGRL